MMIIYCAVRKMEAQKAQYSFPAAEGRNESSAIDAEVDTVIRRSNHNTENTAADKFNLNDTHNHAKNETPALGRRRSQLLAQQSFH